MGRPYDRPEDRVVSPTAHAAGSDTPGGGGGSGGKADFSKVRSGASSTQAQPPKADFSKVRSGASSTEAGSASPARTYTVKSGDSLSKIAKQVYGDAHQWKRIFEANRDQIENPDLIHPGQVLHLPD